jgi:transcriptional regulator with XRE-family HTH domain
VPKQLGKTISRIRRKKGLTQQQAANRYGCSLRWWQTLEHGTNVTVVILTKIGKVLSVPRSVLLK